MPDFCVYNIDTGEIVRSGAAPDEMIDMQAGEGEAVLRAAASDATHFVLNEEIADRPTLLVSDSNIAPLEELRLALPAGTVVTIGGEEHVIEDGVLVLSSDRREVMELRLNPPFPYLPANIRVTVE